VALKREPRSSFKCVLRGALFASDTKFDWGNRLAELLSAVEPGAVSEHEDR